MGRAYIPPPPKEEIPVKLPDGRSFYLDFDPENDTVEDLRNKAAKLAGITVKDLHFLDDQSGKDCCCAKRRAGSSGMGKVSPASLALSAARSKPFTTGASRAKR